MKILIREESVKLQKSEKLKLSNDASPAIRREFIYWQLKHIGVPPEDELVNAALDSSSKIRALGRFYLKKFYEVDMYPLYAKRSDEKRFYIADYAKKSDVEIFISGIQSKYSRTRYICLNALIKCDCEFLRRLDIVALASSSTRIQRLLAPALPKVLKLEELVALKPAFEMGSQNGIRIFFVILEKESFWTFLDMALEHLDSDIPSAIRLFLTERITSYQGYFGPISPDLEMNILNRLKDIHDDEIVKLVRFWLRIS